MQTGDSKANALALTMLDKVKILESKGHGLDQQVSQLFFFFPAVPALHDHVSLHRHHTHARVAIMSWLP
jgi:hypothetical protein